ncbi:MAG: NDP-sugar synthase, partial [Chromatiaceae bacterium]|nr:NDP-sugar synthase [Chromatiaceae bacterium]
MRALVFADRQGAELAPLTENLPLALLPVVGKEVLVHGVEDIVGAGIRDLVIVVSDHADQIEAALGDGRRWGAKFRFVLSRGGEDPVEIWQRLNLGDQEPVLVLRGDVLRAPAVASFLEQAQGRPGTAVIGESLADPRGGLVLLRAGGGAGTPPLSDLRWTTTGAPAQPDGAERLDLGAVDLNLLADIADYHRANRDIVAGRFHGIPLPGRTVALGLSVGRRANVSPKCLKQGVAFVGANSRVHPEAELIGEVVIGDDVVVDRGATIRDSVILSKTYVGELVEVANAVVASNLLIRVDTGAVLRISDAFLLANLAKGGATGALGRWLDRLAGLLLLILSLPLWLVAAFLAQREGGGGRLLEARDMEGDRREQPGDPMSPRRTVVLLHWRTRVPVLRHLPWLLAVVRGDLRLVGVSPLTPEQSAARDEDWQFVRDAAPVGLLGPTQFQVPA